MAGFDARAVRWIRFRLLLCGAVFFVLLGCVMARAVYLQLAQGDKLGGMARDQYLRDLELTPRRGNIVDAKGVSLATSVDTESIYVVPSMRERLGEEIPVRQLAKVLSLEPDFVQKRISGKGAFAWLKRRVTPREREAVAALGLKSVASVREYRRFYPQKQLAAHVVGLVNLDNEGIDGVEREHNQLLKGSLLEVKSLQDVSGRKLFMEPTVPSSAFVGAQVQLTIDSSIQAAAESALGAAVARAKAQAGVVVVMEPKTGAVLALANAPSFNPNAPGEAADARRNRSVTDAYEPGSTIKCFVLAGGIADGIITPQTRIDLSGGKLTFGRKTIRDSHAPKEEAETVTTILATSSNVGTARVGLKLGGERLVGWLKAFGFGERSGIGLPGDRRGQLQDPAKMGEVARATTSFGQGMTATPIQIAAALSAIANGGKLLKPYIVQRAVEADGTVVFERKPEVVREVIPPKVAEQVTGMMIAVTEKGGTGTLAAIPGLRVAGKTGTAQKVDPNTRAYGSKRYSSFMGFVPAEDPKVAIYVALDEPQGDVYGGVIAAPVFREVALEALRQAGVPLPATGQALDAAAARQAKSEKKGTRVEKVQKIEKVEAAEFDEGFVDDGSDPVAQLDDDFMDGTSTAGNMIVPDLKGLSARAALRLLGERQLEVELEGSGRAVRQAPEAGRQVAPGTKVRVVLGAG